MSLFSFRYKRLPSLHAAVLAQSNVCTCTLQNKYAIAGTKQPGCTVIILQQDNQQRFGLVANPRKTVPTSNINAFYNP